MPHRITDEGVEDDGRKVEEVIEFIGEVSPDFKELLIFVAHHDDFTQDDFQSILEAVYTYCKYKRGE